RHLFTGTFTYITPHPPQVKENRSNSICKKRKHDLLTELTTAPSHSLQPILSHDLPLADQFLPPVTREPLAAPNYSPASIRFPLTFAALFQSVSHNALLSSALTYRNNALFRNDHTASTNMQCETRSICSSASKHSTISVSTETSEGKGSRDRAATRGMDQACYLPLR